MTGDNAGGSVGVDLLSGNAPAPTPVGVFTYNGRDGKYYFNGAATGRGFQPGVLHLAYTLTSAAAYTLQVTGAITYQGVGAFAAPLTGFEVHQTAASPTSGANFNAFFNSLRLSVARPKAVP